MNVLPNPSMAAAGEVVETGWFLCGRLGPDDSLVRVPICCESFLVGRRPGMHLTLASPRVSGRHAELLVIGDTLFIRDLGSKNGTFVNRRRVTQLTPIGEGDHIELADTEFRVEYKPNQAPPPGTAGSFNETSPEMEAFESAWVFTQLDELIAHRAVEPYFQSIIDVRNGSTMGYEALARSKVSGLENPAMMYQMAELVNREVELSLVCRKQAVRMGRTLPKGTGIFLNTHPAESLQIDVLTSVKSLRSIAPEHQLVVEIHESTIDDLKTVRRFIAELKDLKIGIAYDDFGAGRSRLLELIQAPPDYLKFDLCLIRNIDRASVRQRKMLKTFVDMVHDMGTLALAEGVETAGEAECCRDIGFELMQGFYYGRPKPINEHVDVPPDLNPPDDPFETSSFIFD